MVLFTGSPVQITYAPSLRDTAGNEAHAATFIPQRVLLHELFHFVWVRLGNPRRLAWEAHLQQEFAQRTRGEAGWSAEWRKRALTPADRAARTRRWREYCCESFCDTASALHARPTESTLAPRPLAARTAWFATHLGPGPFRI
jgi:hypothetical protein